MKALGGRRVKIASLVALNSRKQLAIPRQVLAAKLPAFIVLGAVEEGLQIFTRRMEFVVHDEPEAEYGFVFCHTVIVFCSQASASYRFKLAASSGPE